jgi:hypothetical protein
MTVRYEPIKNTYDGTDADALAYNNNLLAEGVRGIECKYVGYPSNGQTIDYANSIPWDCIIVIAEEYANGAINFKIKNTKLDKIVGYLIVRP